MAKAAAINARPDILRLLLDRGANVSRAESSVLDDIALLLPQDHGVAFQDVVSQLAAAGDRPHRPSTLAAFERWLPNVAIPPLHPSTAQLSESALVLELAAELESLWDEWTGRIDTARDVEQRCAFASATSAASDGADLSFAAKQLYESRLTDGYRARLEQLAETKRKRQQEYEEELAEDPHARQALEGIEEMFEHAYAGRWANAMSMASQADPSAARWLLVWALENGAPLQTVMDLVDLAGGVPDDAMLRLTKNPWLGGVDVAEALVRRHGLDLHFVQEDGRHAFANVADRFFVMSIQGEVNEPALALAKFLVAHSVPMQAHSLGLDALDRVLHRLSDAPFAAPAATGFARFLIEAGARVERSHLELMDAIRGLHPEVYRRLVEAVPELATH